MFEVDLEFTKNDFDTKLILEWIFATTSGRFYSLDKHRYWFFENKEDADRFKDEWYEIPFQNFTWKNVEYEHKEDDITSNIHHIILYFPEHHNNGIKWKMHEWCEKNIGRYARVWHSNHKVIHIEGHAGDTTVAYIFCFSKKEDAMKFKLVWAK